MKDSQINPYEHSDIKVKLLKLYLEKYINILALAKGVTTVEVYDLFCGEGIYSNGKEGSPVIILRLIKDIYYKAKKNSNVKFNCNFNDFNSEKTVKLSNYISEKKMHYSEMGTLNYYNEDYQILKDKIVKAHKVKGAKRFIFIDPYGYKNISVGDIEGLLSDKNTEVLLFLPTQFMYRFEKKSTPESLYNFLAEVMPEEEQGMSSSGVDFIHKLRDGFGNKLKGKHYVDSFIITRNINEFFALYFFTSHLYGFEKFLEAKWSIDEEEGRGWSPKFEEVDLFSTIEVHAKTNKFEENLITFLSQLRSNIEIHHFTIENRHLTTHTVQILKKIQNSNNLIVNNTDRSKPRKGAFYIGWNEVKTKTVKCFIKYENNGTI
ncbi:three-Cys-motif partner protein TcmP [Flavobacterium sp. P4023]|uniref:Three-Cys-motif partner protein TcmP n=1 Tax=Flavobacterium flabelliforme TaxID=2816119 RepID=A0ABS5CVH3_9FLAO|nr:three-Cys-motif partner protein TcmP [Flavobacterium flabelliforme]MBP4142626.1 three-Cys-motif partner protein TcmP [Flavobacterium flabelliforme]